MFRQIYINNYKTTLIYHCHECFYFSGLLTYIQYFSLTSNTGISSTFVMDERFKAFAEICNSVVYTYEMYVIFKFSFHSILTKEHLVI